MGPLCHLHAPQGPTCGTVQPSYLGHARLVRWQLWLLHGAFYVLCALAAHKPAHGHVHGRKAGEKECWRELKHKGGCCCFGWSVYAPWAFYMGIWALYNPKLPIWPLIAYCLFIAYCLLHMHMHMQMQHTRTHARARHICIWLNARTRTKANAERAHVRHVAPVTQDTSHRDTDTSHKTQATSRRVTGFGSSCFLDMPNGGRYGATSTHMQRTVVALLGCGECKTNNTRRSPHATYICRSTPIPTANCNCSVLGGGGVSGWLGATSLGSSLWLTETMGWRTLQAGLLSLPLGRMHLDFGSPQQQASWRLKS
jgi:hypothetical protein